MKKHILLFVAFFSTSLFLFAQSKIESGVTTEGAWCMKNESTIPNMDYGRKNNWGSGFGTYVSMPIGWHFSLYSGINYRYSECQKGTPIWKHVTNTSSILSGHKWIKSSRNYLVVP